MDRNAWDIVIASPAAGLNRRQRSLLLIAAAVSSISGLAIELLLGTLASYLVGNQALAYGLSVGGFLAAMGMGAFFSRWIAPNGPVAATGSQRSYNPLLTAFVVIELLMAPLSAALPLALFALFVINGPFWIGLFLVTLILGTLAGMEVPILTRILEPETGVNDALAGVLALDYFGALLGSLLCPVLLLPWLGLFPSAVVIGALPAVMVFVFSREFAQLRPWRWLGLGLAVGLCVCAPLTVPVGDRLENTLYKSPIVSRIQSPYQRIVLTRRGSDYRLFLDGDLQLSTLDEYRYHEALVHPALSANLAANLAANSNANSNVDVNVNKKLNANANASPNLTANAQAQPRRQVLVMGAGDGMAVREVLKWPDVDQVLLIDLDRAVVDLAKRHPALARISQNALDDPRVQVQVADAFVTAPSLTQQFDVIIADFPDPDRAILAKLYAQGFYQRLLARLKPNGVFVTQASSPFFAPKAFACIAATLESIGLSTHPYVIDVPSFGPWGFVLAARQPIQPRQLTLPITTRFLTAATLPNLFQLPGDIQLGQVEVNRLVHPVIVDYQNNPRWQGYEQG
jgi:spermidine synthase